MPLTHCPDPPNLCDTGPGTAAEQSARPRMYADYENGGWRPATAPVPPMTPLTVTAAAAEFTNSQGWLLAASEPMDWVSGALNDSGVASTQFNFETPGAHTVTATAVDDGAVATIDVMVRDQTVAPTLASLTPNTYPWDTTEAVEVVLTGTGFTAGARPRIVLDGNAYEPSYELISPTQMRIWVDNGVHPGETGNVFVWFPDGSTTYARDLNAV